jgi:hypothetical protein
MLDQTFRIVWRNFSTLFLIVAVVAVPLHIGYSLIHRRAIGVSELHDLIRNFPTETRQVHGVGRPQLDAAERDARVVLVVELVLLPFAAGAARRVAAVDEAGGVPTVVGAWTHCVAAWLRPAPPTGPGAVVVGVAVAAGVFVLARSIGLLVAEPAPEAWAFVLVGAAEALARAFAAPFALIPLGLLPRRAKDRLGHHPTQ